jgi:DNA modification methylase
MDLVFTDPPYGMNAVSKSGVLSKTYGTDIMNDDNNDVAVESFILSQELFGNAKQVWWGANYYSHGLPDSECWIVWNKNNGGSDQTDAELAWTNFRSVVRMFTLASEKTNRVHPTQKPVKLIADIFNKFDKENIFDHVIDLFGGSGSTLMACEQTNKTCYTMELDPKYVDVIIKRWEEFTGEKAKKIN